MAVLHAATQTTLDDAEPLTIDAAVGRAQQSALVASVIGAVGLELEAHLVDLDAVREAVAFDRVDPVPDSVRAGAGRSAISFEPGGQLELSGALGPDIVSAATELRVNAVRTRLALDEFRLGLAYAGADPLRPSRRVNQRSRYRAMEEHFIATGRATPGAVMMNSTAAMQVNLQAGPERGWAERVAHAYRLGPTLVAISACSPWLHERDTGWKSARQRAWSGLDARACGPVPGCFSPAGTGAAAGPRLEPAAAWARFAMAAPVVFVRTGGDDAAAVRTPVSFGQWVSGAVRLGGRMPTAADLDTHLTTLFPPVRLRGYLELRYLDMTAPRWWPAIAAVVTTLMDDPVAVDQAAEAAERTATLWTQAARAGLTDPVLAESARRCLRIAAERVPSALGAAVADLAELVESGRCPGDLLSERIAEIGPQAAFEELAHA